MKTRYPHGLKIEHLTEYTAYPVHMERMNWLINNIIRERKQGPIKILDVGCGTGNITIPLGMIPDAEVVGIDMYQPNIDLVNQRNTLPNVRVQFARLGDFNVREFDFIIFTEVLEHIPGYGEILEDLSKRMKSSAKILVTIPNGWGPFEWAMTPLYFMRKIGLNGFIGRIKKLLGKKEPYALNQEIDPHVNFFTRSRIKKDCRKYGLQLESFERAFVFSPILETYTPFISLNSIAPLDNQLAQKLPPAFASGWYYQMGKAE